jgi:triacylglycerol lipase
MTLRLSRRQVLSSLAVAASAGLGIAAFNHPEGQAEARSLMPAFSVTNIQPLSSTRQNTYPIMLVHGFAGWGRQELHGKFFYWGGFRDIQTDLINNGYETMTASIGPFSSNWDRACELFAQIKGGRVDYGQAHSNQFGHARYGRAYAGMYPQWGEINAQTGQVHKLHLVAHSLGGPTVRLLAQLLEQGSDSEQAATSQGQLSPLFAGGKTGWIDSITTISSMHNGASAAYLTKNLLPNALFSFLATTVGDNQLLDYDFMLDQWGLTRQPGESLATFQVRVVSSKFNTTTDAAGANVAPEFMVGTFNPTVKAQSDIFYFSVGTLATHAGLLDRQIQVPDVTMDPILLPTGIFMGKYTQSQPVVINSTWFANDGLVNTNSMAGPTLNTPDTIVAYNGDPARGQWSNFGVMNGFDHLDIIGIPAKDVRPWYRSLAGFLASLPQ